MARSDSPPLRVRLVGRAMTATVARAPFLWPLLRTPMRGYFEELAQGWDERVGAGSAEHLAAFAAAAAALSETPERALEIGCGTGEGTLFLSREFPQARVRGIDISPEMIRLAIAKVGLDPEGRVAFKVADASAIPWPDESFDLVAQLNMPPFFAEIARVVRPGGSVIVADSIGDRTPFHTPPAVLRRGFRRQGLETVAEGGAGEGTYLIARRPA
jgi:ubiquinone/menaquinone biosynthesis C-methylase UbiE